MFKNLSLGFKLKTKNLFLEALNNIETEILVLKMRKKYVTFQISADKSIESYTKIFEFFSFSSAVNRVFNRTRERMLFCFPYTYWQQSKMSIELSIFKKII